MARLLLIFMALAVCAVFAMILYTLWAQMMRPEMAQAGKPDMAPTGIQKAAYIALIIVLFGVASGWLGGL